MEEEKQKPKRFRAMDAVLLILVISLIAAAVIQQREIARQAAEIASLSKSAGSGGSSPFTETVSAVRGSIAGISIYKNMTVHSSGTTFQEQDDSDSEEELEAGEATGVVIGRELVLTCYHVVSDTDRIAVSIPSGSEEEAKSFDGTLLDADEVRDLAILSVPGLDAKPVEIGDSDQLQAGDQLICIANPASGKLAASVSTGVVSGLNRTMQSANAEGKYVKMFQTDAAINGGSSGGGVFSTDGKLVGIISRKYISTAASDTQLEGIGMCIPINEAAELLAAHF